MTNSAAPDQLASSEANWSGSVLFAETGHVVLSKRRVKWSVQTLIRCCILQQLIWVCTVSQCRSTGFTALWRHSEKNSVAIDNHYLDFILGVVWLHWSLIIRWTTTLRKFCKQSNQKCCLLKIFPACLALNLSTTMVRSLSVPIFRVNAVFRLTLGMLNKLRCHTHF